MNCLFFIFSALQVFRFELPFLASGKALASLGLSILTISSEQFLLGRGCQQGDPLSLYLYILAIEPLAMTIKNHNGIHGLKVGHHQFKIGQYGDDTFLLLDGKEKSLKEP